MKTHLTENISVFWENKAEVHESCQILLKNKTVKVCWQPVFIVKREDNRKKVFDNKSFTKVFFSLVIQTKRNEYVKHNCGILDINLRKKKLKTSVFVSKLIYEGVSLNAFKSVTMTFQEYTYYS